MSDQLAPLGDDDWPEEVAGLRAGFAGQLNVYRTMAHHPALLAAWAGLREHLVRRSALGPERSEVVILRTGIRLDAGYEWAHHVVRARRLGMDDDRIRSLRGAPSAMAPEDGLIATGVDELVADAALSPETRARLMAALGKAAVLDLIATVGFYTVLAGILKSFGTPVDAEIAAELAARPI
ncbi:carboxymuconolactone decarboxylase family protein [Paralimibaculum aggregatum]|uniref:Carboxymuconolactone decarboxylase family protein n=1 Tax=Paralimibaculum aggregatum TaxID=3036245 RepID=A0ABQ6LJW4_9RHOB|nr:carboxymuconolactone decarboxylase family protein [Limibaculum sp. NKW23]GMG83539.1 carboxymuconolactone decarboxylase family protein [Limibaculum sp. NKW23]